MKKNYPNPVYYSSSLIAAKLRTERFHSFAIMESIFHEKQKERLCGQHCLNNLLQGAYFGPVELSDVAHTIDIREREQMAECGTETASYREFVEAPSENVDDTGYFSVEVLKAALLPWNLELVPYSSSDERAKIARENPTFLQAYICHYSQHWYTVRKIGRQWFNLDSTFKKPKLLSDTYLEVFLAQLQSDGHTIFIVFGDLPSCPADDIFTSRPVIRETRNQLVDVINIDEDDEDEKNFKLALQMSLGEAGVDSNFGPGPSTVDVDEVRRKRLQHFVR